MTRGSVRVRPLRTDLRYGLRNILTMTEEKSSVSLAMLEAIFFQSGNRPRNARVRLLYAIYDKDLSK